MKPVLNTAPIGSDIIKEEFNNIENLPLWIGNLRNKNLICKCLYYILIFFR